MGYLQFNYYVNEIRFGDRVLRFEQEIWTIGYVEDQSGDELFVIRSPKGDIVPSGFAEVDNSMGVGFEFDTDTFFPLGRYGYPEGSVRISTVAVVRRPHNVWLWTYLMDEDGNNVATFCGYDELDGLSRFAVGLEEEFGDGGKSAAGEISSA